MSSWRSPKLMNGPCAGMEVGVHPPGTKAGTGIAVRLLNGGYALYSRGPSGHYYYDQTVSKAELSFEPLKKKEKQK